MARNCEPIWDELAFRHLLAVEMARARRTSRPFFALVVEARGAGSPPSEPRERGGDGASWLALAVSRCLRETDLVGWCRRNRTVGALLTEAEPGLDTARELGRKVLREVTILAPHEVAARLKVRIYRYGVQGARTGFHRVSARDLEAGSPALILTESTVSCPDGMR